MQDLDLSRIRQPSFSQSNSVTIGNHDSIHIILPPSAAHATSSGTLSMLHRCVVDMSRPTSTGRPFAGLTLKNINKSLIICGHVNGAAHLTNVSNSIVVVTSRQFRMHESKNCDVYLLTSSRPIIEDCSRIRFSPLPTLYRTEEDDLVQDQWREVDDFKWLRAEPSPNWSVLEEQKRITERVWKDVVPGGPQIGVDEILQAVGVSK
jgi:tubulin-specific chaperone C